MIGTRLGPYDVTAKLGEGGMGEVFRATDTRLGREVAIKVLPAEVAGDAERLRRFEQEARAASALNHPGILTVHDFASDAGVFYLVTELLEGESLRDRLRRGVLSEREALRFAAEVARGLAAAHAKGIVHRDLKPENLFLGAEGRAKILDFGLAKLAPTTAATDPAAAEASTKIELTAAGSVLGTVGYMAPEQVRGEPVDARADLFSLGCVLFEMLTGERAFRGASAMDVLSAILRDEPEPLRACRPGVSPALGRIVERCLEKNRSARYGSASELLVALETASTPGLEPPYPAVAAAEGGSPRARRRWPFAAAGVAVVALGVAASWLLLRRSESGSERQVGLQSPPRPIAVLPFTSLGTPEELGYLTVALPDSIATTLSRIPALAVRPFARSRALATVADPGAAGRELRAEVVLTGHLMLAGHKLTLALEALDVEADRIVWRERLEVSQGDLLALERAVVRHVDEGLVSALGIQQAKNEANAPHDPEAYGLYLRAVALPGEAFTEAQALLERSVALDPTYGPAWAELGNRAYQDASYGDGGPASYERSEEAYQRALALDPELVEAAAGLAFDWTERGRLEVAYDIAARLAVQRPRSAIARSAVMYVLRFGGLYGESARQCELARELDPHEGFLGSCALSYYYLGDHQSAGRFLAIRQPSQWAQHIESFFLLRSGRTAEFLQRTPELISNSTWPTRFVAAGLQGRPVSEVARLAEEYVTANARVLRDGESSYLDGSLMAFSGLGEPALDLLRQAVDGRFCAFPAVDTDPLLDRVRDAPGFATIRAGAIACREQFRTYVEGDGRLAALSGK